MTVCRRRRAAGSAVSTLPSRSNGSRNFPSDSATRSGSPRTRPHDCHSAATSAASGARKSSSESAGSWCSRMMVMVAGQPSAGWLQADGNAEIRRHRQMNCHLDAADRAPHHDALAGQFDRTDALVGCLVAGLKPQWKGEGVEPHRAARPRRHGPAYGSLTPQFIAPRRVFPVNSPGFPGQLLAPSEFCPPDR